jgi:hypothetical protein
VTSAPDLAARLANSQRTAAVADVFTRRLCFICYDVLSPKSEKRVEVPAHAVWIGPSPKFLCLLLCEECWRSWLADAYSTADAHHWPTTTFGIKALGLRGT